MKVQSVDSSSINLLAEKKIKVFKDGSGVNLAGGAVQLPDKADAEPKPKQDPDPQVLSEAVDKANQTLEIYNTELRFSIHQESGEIQVKVINTRDNSVIREIPPEVVLNFVAYIKKTLGIIIDRFI